MKKQCLALMILAGTIFSTSQSMLQMCLGAGIAGVSYALYQETERLNRLGIAGKVGRMGVTYLGWGTPIQKLRLEIQKGILEAAYHADPENCPVDTLESAFKAEKILYGSSIILGSMLALYGLRDFFTSK